MPTCDRTPTRVNVDTKGSKSLPPIIQQLLLPDDSLLHFPVCSLAFLPPCPPFLSTTVYLVCRHRSICVIPQIFYQFQDSIPTLALATVKKQALWSQPSCPQLLMTDLFWGLQIPICLLKTLCHFFTFAYRFVPEFNGLDPPTTFLLIEIWTCVTQINLRLF